MSEGSPAVYNEGDIVWVKLGPSWWPGEVIDLKNLPEDAVTFKKPPLYIVKFFDEEKYEYVRSIMNIYPYNCDKKSEFIKKGMAAHRLQMVHMEKFPKDVVKAEVRLGGNPNILSDPAYLPEKKRNIVAELFGSPSPKVKKVKDKKGRSTKESLNTSNITHRRFLGSPELDDYRAFICIQYPGKGRDPNNPEDNEVIRLNSEPEQEYPCQSCQFTTKSIEILIFHTKSHMQGTYVSATGKNLGPKKEGARSSQAKSNKIRSPRKQKPKAQKSIEPPKTDEPDQPDQPEPTKASALPTELLAEWDDSDEEVLNAAPFDSTLNTSQEDSSAMDTTFDATLNSTAEETTVNESMETSVNESLNESQDTENDIQIENTTEPSTEKEKELSEPEESEIAVVSSEPEDSVKAVVSNDDSISTKTNDQPISKSSELIKESSTIDRTTQDAIKSCFDFDEDDEEEPPIVSTVITGRKIPRVIPLTERKKSNELDFEDEEINTQKILKTSESLNKRCSTENDDERAELDLAFKELMETTKLPELPDVQNNLKCEQNFHNIETIKFPDKPKDSGGSTPPRLKPDKTEPEIATKLTNPKKRFVKSFEDFEQMQSKIKKTEEVNKISAQSFEAFEQMQNEMRLKEEETQTKKEYEGTSEVSPKETEEQTCNPTINFSNLKTKMMFKMKDDATNKEEPKSKAVNTVDVDVSKKLENDPPVKPRTRRSTEMLRTPRSKILESYRKERVMEEEKNVTEPEPTVEQVEIRECVPPKKKKWSRGRSLPKKYRKLETEESQEETAIDDIKPQTSHPKKHRKLTADENQEEAAADAFKPLTGHPKKHRKLTADESQEEAAVDDINPVTGHPKKHHSLPTVENQEETAVDNPKLEIRPDKLTSEENQEQIAVDNIDPQLSHPKKYHKSSEEENQEETIADNTKRESSHPRKYRKSTSKENQKEIGVDNIKKLCSHPKKYPKLPEEENQEESAADTTKPQRSHPKKYRKLTSEKNQEEAAIDNIKPQHSHPKKYRKSSEGQNQEEKVADNDKPESSHPKKYHKVTSEENQEKTAVDNIKTQQSHPKKYHKLSEEEENLEETAADNTKSQNSHPKKYRKLTSEENQEESATDNVKPQRSHPKKYRKLSEDENQEESAADNTKPQSSHPKKYRKLTSEENQVESATDDVTPQRSHPKKKYCKLSEEGNQEETAADNSNPQSSQPKKYRKLTSEENQEESATDVKPQRSHPKKYRKLSEEHNQEETAADNTKPQRGHPKKYRKLKSEEIQEESATDNVMPLRSHLKKYHNLSQEQNQEETVADNTKPQSGDPEKYSKMTSEEDLEETFVENIKPQRSHPKKYCKLAEDENKEEPAKNIMKLQSSHPKKFRKLIAEENQEEIPVDETQPQASDALETLPEMKTIEQSVENLETENGDQELCHNSPKTNEIEDIPGVEQPAVNLSGMEGSKSFLQTSSYIVNDQRSQTPLLDEPPFIEDQSSNDANNLPTNTETKKVQHLSAVLPGTLHSDEVFSSTSYSYNFTSGIDDYSSIGQASSFLPDNAICLPPKKGKKRRLSKGSDYSSWPVLETPQSPHQVRSPEKRKKNDEDESVSDNLDKSKEKVSQDDSLGMSAVDTEKTNLADSVDVIDFGKHVQVGESTLDTEQEKIVTKEAQSAEQHSVLCVEETEHVKTVVGEHIPSEDVVENVAVTGVSDDEKAIEHLSESHEANLVVDEAQIDDDCTDITQPMYSPHPVSYENNAATQNEDDSSFQLESIVVANEKDNVVDQPHISNESETLDNASEQSSVLDQPDARVDQLEVCKDVEPLHLSDLNKDILQADIIMDSADQSVCKTSITSDASETFDESKPVNQINAVSASENCNVPKMGLTSEPIVNEESGKADPVEVAEAICDQPDVSDRPESIESHSAPLEEFSVTDEQVRESKDAIQDHHEENSLGFTCDSVDTLETSINDTNISEENVIQEESVVTEETVYNQSDLDADQLVISAEESVVETNESVIITDKSAIDSDLSLFSAGDSLISADQSLTESQPDVSISKLSQHVEESMEPFSEKKSVSEVDIITKDQGVIPVEEQMVTEESIVEEKTLEVSVEGTLTTSTEVVTDRSKLSSEMVDSKTDSVKVDEPELEHNEESEKVCDQTQTISQLSLSNEIEIRCSDPTDNGVKFSIQTNLSNFTSKEELSVMALASLAEAKCDSDSNTSENVTDMKQIPDPTLKHIPDPILPPHQPELVPIEGSPTVVSEKDLADGQVEITPKQVISSKKPAMLSNFSMDFTDSPNTNDAKGTEFTSSAITKELKPPKKSAKKQNTYERLELLDILEGNSEQEKKVKDKPLAVPRTFVADDGFLDFEEHIPSQIVCAETLRREKEDGLKEKNKEKDAKGRKNSIVSTTSKLLERLSEGKTKESGKIAKVPKTKAQPESKPITPAFQDFEDVEAFIIHKEMKKPAESAEPTDVKPTKSATASKTVKVSGKAKILQQTIITPAGEIIQPENASQAADDNIFDINSMPIVLSDDIMTPEDIEKMPIVIGSEATVTKSLVHDKVLVSTAGGKPILKKFIGKLPTSNPVLVNQSPAVKTSAAKIAKVPKIIQKPTSVVPGLTKPGKYIIVPHSAGLQTTKYVAAKKQPTIIKRAAPAPGSLLTKVQNVAPEPSGNKIMVVTNQQGQQQRLLLTPAQQKMLGYQNTVPKITKTITKPHVVPKTVAITEHVPSKTGSIIGQKVIISTSGSQNILLGTTHQVMSPQLKTVKHFGKRMSPVNQKVTPKQKTILITNKQGQTVRKVQGTEEDLEKQVAEQLEAIRASSGIKFGTQPKIPEALPTTKVVTKSPRRSYARKPEIKPRVGPPALAEIHSHKMEMKKSESSLSQSDIKQIAKATETKAKPDRPLNQLVIQDALGNQTTITEGQILAIPSETVDGHPQSYMLVTLDESGNLTPLNNEALMSLDANLGLGGDLSNNMVLQIDQSALTGNVSDQRVPLAQPAIVKANEPVHIDPVPPVPSVGSTTEIATEQIIEQKPTEPLPITEPVGPSSNGDPGQQLIVTGDPIATQKFLESLTEGTTDLANILANADGNSILIQADGQQILINTNASNQMMLSVNNDNISTSENTEGGGNPMFATHPTKNQDILAAALADTDVFQPDQHSQSKIVSQLSPSNALYPMNVGNVLETSLTLNSPIMTPLEVPSTNNKKIPDEEADILTQVPKNVDLPITITDPNIAQTVTNQQVASLIATELQTNLDLGLPISETTISTVSTDINSPSYSYSLPTLDDTVDMTHKPFNSSMPLLTEEVEETIQDSNSAKTEESIISSDNHKEGNHMDNEDSNSVDSKKQEDSVNSDGSFLDDEGRFTLGGEMCSSLSEPPPEMFDLPERSSDTVDNSKDVDTDPSTHTDSSNDDSCEIPLQPQIVAKASYLTSLNRSVDDVEENGTTCEFD